MKILAVDDETATLKVLARTLEQLGHEVTTAADGRQALQRIADHPVQVVVTDWLMPGADGLELTRRLRARNDARYTYVLLLTVVEGRENWLAAMDAGVDDFLPKPIDTAVLRARLRVAERILDLTARNRALAQLIPICMYCKQTRTDQDYWMGLDRWLAESGNARLSHGVCPACVAKHVAPAFGVDTPPSS